MRRTLRVGDRGSDKPACVPSKSVSPLKRREKDGLVTSGRARRHDVTKGVWGFWGVEGGSVMIEVHRVPVIQVIQVGRPASLFSES